MVNYCLRALVGKGQVKIRNFRASNNKRRYAYILTPRGVAARAALTRVFLRRKMVEYEALRAEIAALKTELGDDAAQELALGPEDGRASGHGD